MYLAETFQTDFGILRALDETDHLTDGRVHLPDDGLHSHHHAEAHVALDDGAGRKKGNQDVLRLVDEESPALLPLAEAQPLDAHLEQLGLNVLPLPAFLPLAVVERTNWMRANRYRKALKKSMCSVKGELRISAMPW